MRKYVLLVVMVIMTSCTKHADIPVESDWIGLSTKQEVVLEKKFRTAGRGNGLVHWWAGGYLWANGGFTLQLFDEQKNKLILEKTFRYGDTDTGQDEKPKFQWWHSEQDGIIEMRGGRVYKMVLKSWGLAQPGAGWGLWLYEFGKETGHPKAPE